MILRFFQFVLELIHGISLVFWRLMGLFLVIMGSMFMIREVSLIGAGDNEFTLTNVAHRLGMNQYAGWLLIVSIIGIGIVCMVYRPVRRFRRI